MNVLILILVFTAMAIGIAGSLLPAIPGSPLIMAAALAYSWYTHFEVISVTTLLTLAVIMVLSFLVDYLSGLVGAKKYGASRWGVIGAFLGGILGLFFGLPGLLVGPFVGAFVAELATGKAPKEAMLIGWGSFIGVLGGGVVKTILAIAMVIIFTVALF